MAAITDAPPAATGWTDDELASWRAAYPPDASYALQFSKYNPTPGV